MKKLLVLISLILMTSPVLANRPRLSGPSNSKRLARHNRASHRRPRVSNPKLRGSSRNHVFRRYIRRPIYYIIYIVPRPIIPRHQPNSVQQQAPSQRHKTVIVRPRNNRRQLLPVGRNQILAQCKQKVRRNVYKKTERKQ